MSTLTTDRIRETATKLGLTHIAEVVTQLVDRAEQADMGYPNSKHRIGAHTKDGA